MNTEGIRMRMALLRRLPERGVAMIIMALLQIAVCQIAAAQSLRWGTPEHGASKTKNDCAAMTFSSPGAIGINARGDLYVAEEKGDSALEVLRVDGSRATLLDRRDGSIRSGHYTGISLALDSTGSVFLAFKDRGTVEKLDPNGKLTLVAGKSGDLRSVDGPASVGRFKELAGIATNNSGDLVVIDRKAIRKIDSSGSISSLAGDRKGKDPDLVDEELNIHDGVGVNARFVRPSAIAIGPNDDVFVADGYSGDLEGRHESIGIIRRISKDGKVTTFAGRVWGDVDGKGTESGMGYVSGMAYDSKGSLYLGEYDLGSIRRLDRDADVTTVLSPVFDPLSQLPAAWAPKEIAVSKSGDIYFSDTDDGRIYRLREAKRLEMLCAQ